MNFNYRCTSLFAKSLIDFHFNVTIFFLAPSRAPDLVTVYNSSSTSLVVKWNLFPKKQFQGEPIGYEIVYNPAGTEGGSNSMSVNYTKNTTMLTNLTVYTVYVVNVSAVSSGGIGPVNTVRARTGAGGNVVSS